METQANKFERLALDFCRNVFVLQRFITGGEPIMATIEHTKTPDSDTYANSYGEASIIGVRAEDQSVTFYVEEPISCISGDVVWLEWFESSAIKASYRLRSAHVITIYGAAAYRAIAAYRLDLWNKRLQRAGGAQ